MPLYVKEKTEKDASVFSYEDTFSPMEGYVSTLKDPVNAYDYVEQKQEQIQDIGGFSLAPSNNLNNSVYKIGIEASIGPSLAVVTIFIDAFANFYQLKFLLKKGHNEISIFTDEPVDQVDISFDSLGNIVGGSEDNWYSVFAGVSTGAFLA